MCVPMLRWQWLLLAFLCGICCWAIPWISFFLFLLVCLFLAPERPWKFFSVFLAYCSGYVFLLAHLFFFPVPTINLPVQKGVISGKVVSVRHQPGQRLQCVLRDVVWHSVSGKESGQNVPGRVVLTWQYPRAFPVPGQILRVNTKIKPIHGMSNAGGWNSEWYWRQRGVFWRAFVQADKDWVSIEGRPALYQAARQKIRSFLVQKLPESPGRGLALALLLGERLYLSHDVQEKLQRAGLAHSLALSGMHVGIVASFGLVLAWVVGFFWPGAYLLLPRSKLAVICAAPLVLFYLWLGGAGLSLQRSAVMFAVWGVLLLLNRKNILLDGLFVALGLICLLHPLALFDVSLQMSALAVVGIVLFLPVWRQVTNCFLPAHSVVRYISLLFGMTLGANIALFPVLVWNFNMFSPYLVYNLVWLPVLGLVIMPLLFSGLLLAPVTEIGAGFCLRAGADLLDLFVRALHGLDNLGWLECLIVPRPFPEMALTWWAGFFWLLCLGCGQKRQRTTRVAGFLFGLALLGSLVRLSAPYLNRDVRLHLLDMGMSQAVLLVLPHGQRILVDGGGFWNPDFDVGKVVVGPRLTLGRWPYLEKIVLTHDDADHRRGLIFLLRHFQVGAFVWNGRELAGDDGQTIRAALRDRHIPGTVWQQGDKIHLDNGLALEVLWPPGHYEDTDNNLSLVLRLSRNGHGLALLPGDIENPALRKLLATGQDVQADVLVVPHHGSRSSLLPQLYERVRPKYALVAAGFQNRFHFPHSQVVEFCRDRGIKLLTTAASGEITVTWPRGGGQIRLDYQRQEARGENSR